MEVSGVGQYRAMQNGYPAQKTGTASQTAEQKAVSANTDTVTLSGGAEYLKSLQEQFPKMTFSIGNGFTGKTAQNTGDNANRWAFTVNPKLFESAQKKDDGEGDDEAGGEATKSSGCVGINAAKLARMLAAAKTRAQVRAVIAKIESDLRECEAGKEQGFDVDEASVEAAKSILQEAQSRMGRSEDREATPEEEMASALASLM